MKKTEMTPLEKIIDKLSQKEERAFIERKPLAGKKFADLSSGVTIKNSFPDEEDLLATAFAELDTVLDGWQIPRKNNAYRMEFKKDASLGEEEYILSIKENALLLASNDTEGMRRGLYHLAESLQYSGGKRLYLAEERKKMFIRNRISRSYYSPTHRPPDNIDELDNDIDYYPEPYLNILAREGINILWLTVHFSEVSWSSITEKDKECDKRLAKLKKTVEKCRRYGMRIFLFCIEPRGFRGLKGLPEKYPELVGVDWGWDMYGFCPSSPVAQKYLYEITNNLFKSVPNLGGLLNITLGEALSSCFHMTYPGQSCPRCGKLPATEVFKRVVDPMVRGMRDAAPKAELISWFYRSNPNPTEESWIRECEAALPEGSIALYNFESGMSLTQQGLKLYGGDYWQAHKGPSNRFKKLVDLMNKKGKRVAAKLQVSNGHELATIPVIPVPGTFYHKYKYLHNNKVDSVMYSWYFGCFPGLMNQAVQLLSYTDFPETEEDFLLDLAGRSWGEFAPEVARAWKYFSQGYDCYPLDTAIQYYGPFHHGIAWPLILDLELKDLQQTWLPRPASGDAIGRCLGPFSLEKMEKQTGKMARIFGKGVKIMEELAPHFAEDPQRSIDIEYAIGTGLLLTSGWHIFKFYLLRKELYTTKNSRILAQMEKIVEEEIVNTEKMMELCRKNPLIGYHSEAQVCKFTPEILKERLAGLEKLLAEDFPRFRANLAKGILPESPAGEKNALYVADGTFVKQETFSWSLKKAAGGMVKFSFECSYPPGTPNHMSDRLYIHIGDKYYTEPTILMTMTYKGLMNPKDVIMEEYISKPGKEVWKGSCLLPEEYFSADKEMCFNIIRRYECKGKDFLDSWIPDPGIPGTGATNHVMFAAKMGKVVLPWKK